MTLLISRGQGGFWVLVFHMSTLRGAGSGTDQTPEIRP
jgi:hypothetical protein